MLTTLNIKNFAVIDATEISFDRGFTVITGETGAGKSVLINALSLILGGRGRTEVIRTGSKTAEVQALFDIGRLDTLKLRLAQLDLDAGSELIVRRVISRNGRSRAYVNGTMVTLRDLAKITEGLVDISGQHAHYSLLRPDQHLELLDRVGGCYELRERVSQTYDELVELDGRLEEIRTSRAAREERSEFIRFQLAELDAAGLADPDEEGTLEREVGRLRHASRLREVATQAEERLYGQADSATEIISSVVRSIRGVIELDGALVPILADLETAQVLVEEGARTLSGYGRSVQSDPERLEQVESRLTLFQTLRRKYGATLGDVIEKQEQLAAELVALSSSDETIETLVQERDEVAQILLRLSGDLTLSRRRAGERFGASVSAQLADLSMAVAHFVVLVEPLTKGRSIEGTYLSRRGSDRVEFLLSANSGADPQPLGQVASGGELSRVMLAVKQIIAEQDPVATYIFDEVDAGVGGATAESIGFKLRRVGADRQAICITHLPQIAALGTAHLRVEKTEVNGLTESRIRALSKAERTDEIARMLGGRRLTTKTRQHAQEMLSLGQAA